MSCNNAADPLFDRIIFSEQDRVLIETLSAISLQLSSLPYALFRTQIDDDPELGKTFFITSSAHATDVILYTSKESSFSLNIADGGSF